MLSHRGDDDAPTAKRSRASGHGDTVDLIQAFAKNAPNFGAYEQMWTNPPSLERLMKPGGLFGDKAFVRQEYIDLLKCMEDNMNKFNLFQLQGSEGIGKVGNV
jgi:hypothetical protein